MLAGASVIGDIIFPWNMACRM